MNRLFCRRGSDAKPNKVLAGVQLVLIVLLGLAVASYIGAMLSSDLCLEVRIGNQVYGYVSSPGVMHEAAARIEAGGVRIKPEYSFVNCLKAGGALLDEDDCYALLTNYTNTHYLNAFAVSVDGTLLANLSSREDADAVAQHYELLLRRAALADDSEIASVNTAGICTVSETVCEKGSLSEAGEVFLRLDRLFDGEEEEDVPPSDAGEEEVPSGRFAAFSSESSLLMADDAGFEILRRTSVSDQTEEQIEKKLSGTASPNLITYKDVTVTFLIPFASSTVTSSSEYVGTRRVKTVGEDGLGEEVWRVEYNGGKEVSRELISTSVLTPAVDEVIVVGRKEYPKPVVTGKYIWPLAEKWNQVSSYYGWRSDPFTGERRFHRGIDIYAPKDTIVLAADGGTVTYTGYDSSRGLYIVVDMGGGLEFYYEHLHKSLVSKGDKIFKGQEIAKVGMSGRATGYHLHFEVHKNGDTVNPLKYLKRP